MSVGVDYEYGNTVQEFVRSRSYQTSNLCSGRNALLFTLNRIGTLDEPMFVLTMQKFQVVQRYLLVFECWCLSVGVLSVGVANESAVRYEGRGVRLLLTTKYVK